LPGSPESYLLSLQRRKVGRAFLEEAGDALDEVGRPIDSRISFSATALASNKSLMVSAYTCCLITATELGAQVAAMSSA
jgi:hypothetical protein